ncbi:MAG: ISAzo13 family transposase [Clostridia bacterium]|nr:ISAzo13 family transposase [Clostridia bacterium]
MDTVVKERITAVLPLLNESQKRRYLAAEAISLGRGGIKEISAISGVHRNTISAGIQELRSGNLETSERVNNQTRIRAPGGGRKSILETQPGILDALDRLVDPETYGDPMNPLRWTTKSLRTLSEELRNEGFDVHHDKVGDLLEQLGYSLQQNRKMRDGGDPEKKRDPRQRDTQFRHINDTVKKYLESGKPVISIDCRKKENTGNFENAGVEFRPTGKPIETDGHDFIDPDKETAAPYGICDMARSEGFISVGISSDTAVFAVNSIRGWWYSMGNDRYPEATNLYITVYGGGSDSSRSRLWKTELQKLADELLLPIEVSHFPPGTSKWIEIEHRLCSFTTLNWRRKPLETYGIVLSLISSATIKKGLALKAKLDLSEYQTGIKASDEDPANVNITRNPLYGDWNYIIYPHG